jgi:hypothetical protein
MYFCISYSPLKENPNLKKRQTKNPQKPATMKTMKIIPVAALIALAATFTSCRKDYTCTCTTIIGTISTEKAHQIDNSGYADARVLCSDYADQANKVNPGSTTCRL